jgi:hypothetical protein
MIEVNALQPQVTDGRQQTAPRYLARPIFIIGSLRSGVSILSASLSQHPSIMPVKDSGWITHLAASLQHSYAEGVHRRATSQLDIMGIELEDFYAHFGEAIDRLIRQGPKQDLRGANLDQDALSARWGMDGVSGERDGRNPTRWLDASPGTCFHIVGLCRLFPQAKFVHVLRDARSVVRILTDESLRSVYRSQFQHFTEDEAYEHWLKHVNTCVEAERAFGSDTILRVRRDDLVNSPTATLQDCLAFLDLPFDSACLRPFR